MSPIELNEQHDCGRPLLEDSGRPAPSSKDFSQFRVARYLELLDWTVRQLQQRQSGPRSRALGTDPEPGSGSILLAGVTCVA